MGTNLADVYTKDELIALADQHGIARINGKSAEELARDLADSGYVYSEKADARRNPSYPRRYQGPDLTSEPVRVGNAVFTPLGPDGLPDPTREVTEATVEDDGTVTSDGAEIGEPEPEEKSIRPPDPRIAAEVETADDLNPAIQTEPTKAPKPKAEPKP